MPERLTIQINDHDNVAVVVHDLPAGSKLEGGLVTRDPIPQAHKIALRDIPAGGEIVRYGVVLGYAKADIPAGSWINEHMLDLPESPALTDMPWGTRIKAAEELPAPTRTTWLGYRNKVGPAGTRNLLGIVTTVQCAAGVLKVAAERIKKELLPKYPHVDGVVAVTHPYGCGVAINAPLAYLPIRAVSNLIRHPNFGGEIMVVGLGCEKLTYDRVLPPEDITPDNCHRIGRTSVYGAGGDATHDPGGGIIMPCYGTNSGSPSFTLSSCVCERCQTNINSLSCFRKSMPVENVLLDNCHFTDITATSEAAVFNPLSLAQNVAITSCVFSQSVILYGLDQFYPLS